MCVYIYIYSRLRRLRRLIAWVREEVESVRGKGFVRRLSTVSSVSSVSSPSSVSSTSSLVGFVS